MNNSELDLVATGEYTDAGLLANHAIRAGFIAGRNYKAMTDFIKSANTQEHVRHDAMTLCSIASKEIDRKIVERCILPEDVKDLPKATLVQRLKAVRKVFASMLESSRTWKLEVGFTDGDESEVVYGFANRILRLVVPRDSWVTHDGDLYWMKDGRMCVLESITIVRVHGGMYRDKRGNRSFIRDTGMAGPHVVVDEVGDLQFWRFGREGLATRCARDGNLATGTSDAGVDGGDHKAGTTAE
jgi:hypothetical protein